MSSNKVLVFFLFAVILLMSCEEKTEYPYRKITLEAFSSLKTPSFVITPSEIRHHLHHIVKADTSKMISDRQVRAYYGDNNPFLWINRHGIDGRADSLLSYLERVGETGLKEVMFRKKQLAADIERIRNLDTSEQDNINALMARLEYNLTRAFLKYTAGQRYGYINPDKFYNNLCVKDSDSLHVTYFHVFDIPVEHAGEQFFQQAYRKIRKDSVSSFLKEVQPKNKLYYQLVEYLKQTTPGSKEEMLAQCNIERCRWQLKDYPQDHKKYVLVNIPAFQAIAVDGDSVMTMRIGCGSVKTKTPLLTSKIMRMDVNPNWILPKSIAEDVVYKTGYLRREKMYIVDRKKGKVDLSEASYTKIKEGQQYIVQPGGPGNSLGRIIFRFDNNFAVYLHDTSSPWIFNKQNRAVSHGCIRLQRPFDMAVFLMNDKDDELIEKIKYSMTTDISVLYDKENKEEKKDQEKIEIDKDKLINRVEVDPQVPVYITYYTLYPDSEGALHSYNDVYGYDKALYKELKPFIK